MKISDKFWSILNLCVATFAFISVVYTGTFDSDVTNKDLAQSISMALVALIVFSASKKNN